MHARLTLPGYLARTPRRQSSQADGFELTDNFAMDHARSVTFHRFLANLCTRVGMMNTLHRCATPVHKGGNGMMNTLNKCATRRRTLARVFLEENCGKVRYLSKEAFCLLYAAQELLTNKWGVKRVSRRAPLPGPGNPPAAPPITPCLPTPLLSGARHERGSKRQSLFMHRPAHEAASPAQANRQCRRWSHKNAFATRPEVSPVRHPKFGSTPTRHARE